MCGKRLKRWKTMGKDAGLGGACATSRVAQLMQLVAALAVADQLAIDPRAARLLICSR